MVLQTKTHVTSFIIFSCFTTVLSLYTEQPIPNKQPSSEVSITEVATAVAPQTTTAADDELSIQLPQQKNPDSKKQHSNAADKKDAIPADTQVETEKPVDENHEQVDESKSEPPPPPSKLADQRKINEIIITGNQFTPDEAIRNYIPYQVGELFDPRKTGQLIRSVYHGIKRFRTITIHGEDIGTDLINLHIVVEEKTILKDLIIENNKAVSEKEIAKVVDITTIPAVDAEELKILAQKIKKIYLEKGYHKTEIDTELAIDDTGKAIAQFTIHEGKKALVKQIKFSGNEHASDKELRAILFTREDWILSFMDKTGTYHPERLEGDKHMIEQFYQNDGFMQAKITDVVVDVNPKTQHITLTFEIEEGPRYVISEVSAPGNDILSEEYLLSQLPIRPGQMYSRERISNAIKALETIWGNQGYIFAHIEPSIQPDEDAKTVKLSFISDLGKKICLNRITIRGNKKTKDKIIRRKIPLEEGEMLANSRLEVAKHNIESLGYFEQRDGVNWRLNRLNDELADIDFIVKESKTGHANVQIGFGGVGTDLNSPADGVNVKGNITDTNLFGSGTFINLEGSWAKNEQTLILHLAQPWLFDKPISGAIDIYHRRPTYNDLRNTDIAAVNEKVTGGAATIGWITRSNWAILNDTQILGSLGFDSIRYEKLPKSALRDIALAPPPLTLEKLNCQYQTILDREFIPGEYFWLALNVEQQTHNHPIHPSRGHRCKINSKLGFPPRDTKIGYYKIAADGHWFTPLIDEYNLILHLHAFAGWSTPIGSNNVPFSELFNIGGPSSVRGFLFGQIGPKFLGDPIGAQKAFFINVELVFPITPDLNMKGVAFYDGGAGWDAPRTCGISNHVLRGNNFDYRHAVGIGIRILNPTPVKIDWGFKLDARPGESASEVHFGMSYDW